jgi:ATP-dependent helicase/nuclease subunit A
VPAVALTPALPGTAMPTGQRISTRQTAEQSHGIQLHALLEWVAPPGAIADRAWLRERLEVAGAEFDVLWQEASKIMQAPQLQRFFDPACYLNAWKELPYRTARGESRRIDRLVEFADSIWILDFKATEKVESGNLAACAAPYLKQMAEYRTAMQGVVVGKPVKAALVFSNGLLFEVEE